MTASEIKVIYPPTNWYLKGPINQEPFACINDVFSVDEIEKIISIGKARQLVEATVGDVADSDFLRKSKIVFLRPSDEVAWIYQKIVAVVESLNTKFFRYDLTFIENIQFTEYNSAYQGFYGPHTDAGFSDALTRKLSITIQLSDPGEYNGGQLKIYRFNFNPIVTPNTRGTAVLFPSYAIHEVTPVTTGIRYSLVAWVNGPQFR